jgi:putative spermidine/putrescine transport system ATP-binding protein
MQRIEFRDVVVRYGSLQALRKLSLTVEPGEFLALLGPSGCGKTTLLRVLGGFTSYEGSVLFDGQPVDALPAHRRDIGIVFQDYALFPHRTVRENIAFGLRMRKASADDIAARVEEMIALLHLTGLGDRYPGQLSGGQQQRVALARAIAIRPRVLLLDEPLGALDKKLREEMQVELRQLQRNVGITTIFVTHDQEEALSLADRIAVMSTGTIQQIGPTAEIYERPANRFVAEFMGQSNLLPATVVEQRQDVWLCRTASGAVIPAATDAALRTGQEVLLSLRSELLRLASAAPRDAAVSAPLLAGTIDHVTYLGGLIQIRVRVATGEIMKIAVQNVGGFRSVSVGSPAHVTFDPADVVVLTDDGAGAAPAAAATARASGAVA